MIQADDKYRIEDALKQQRVMKYPWKRMDVGQSFPYPHAYQFAYSYSAKASKTYAPKKFMAKKFPDGMRIFRVA